MKMQVAIPINKNELPAFYLYSFEETFVFVI